MKAFEVFGNLGIDVVARAHHAPPVTATAKPLGDRKPDGLDRRQIGIQLVDLEGARQAPQHAAMHGDVRDVVAFQQNPAAVRPEHTGQKVDHGGLAGAVRADQSVTGALRDSEREVARDLEPAELLCQTSGFKRRCHEASLSGTATAALLLANCRITQFGTNSTQRCSRARPISTITTSTRPIQNSQYCGVIIWNSSCNILNTTAPIRPP